MTFVRNIGRPRKTIASICNAIAMAALVTVAISTLASTVDYFITIAGKADINSLTEFVKHCSSQHDKTLAAINTYVKIVRLVMDMIQSQMSLSLPPTGFDEDPDDYDDGSVDVDAPQPQQQQ